jgi:hypothetical protein
MPALFFKPPDHALPGPSGPGHFGRDIGKPGDEMVAVPQAGPVFVKKEDVGLPPGMVPVIPADAAVLHQGGFQKFRLKMVHLLESDEIGVHLFQKTFDHIPAPFPAVLSVFCQAEPQVHGHHTEGCRGCFHSLRMRYPSDSVNFFETVVWIDECESSLAF